MKTKLEMAHEFMLAMIKAGCHDGPDLLDRAWQYADAMQAEADKRDKEEAFQKRKAIREMINADNIFLEKEGQHFDDVEWKPDWSQAPSDALTWAINGKGDATWALYENGEFYSCVEAPSFGYAGDWRDSLRKRPN